MNTNLSIKNTAISINAVFGHYYIEPKGLFLYLFGKIPNIYMLENINEKKVLACLREHHADLIVKEYERKWYDHKKKQMENGQLILQLSNECLIWLEDDYCYFLTATKADPFVEMLVPVLGKMRSVKRQTDFEIHLITLDSGTLQLTKLEINKTKIDLGLYYEEAFEAIDQLIQKRLNKKDDKGIVLLHGMPGTGKTTYLRYLIGKLRKKVLFVSPNVAANITNPDFINLLIDNPNSVLIIEDAENIITDRRGGDVSSVSNLLNISDGLLADCLNVQIICTFNSELSRVDAALLRKGRLIARYEFAKLSVSRAQRLSDHLGYDKIIRRPMSVAEIVNQEEQDFEERKYQPIGFRTAELTV
jgi:ATPase family associated with various cellular activities (AAA)